MAGKFQWIKFSDCDLSDAFFDSLKSDYSEFPEWFEKKKRQGEFAFVYKDELGVCAFLYLKQEEEIIQLHDKTLPAAKRIKIGTLKLEGRVQGQRLGEGAIGVALWRWQNSDADEIYITAFERHKVLIEMLEKFGFIFIGSNKRGENVFLKSKKRLDINDPYKAFPYIIPSFKKAGYIPINDTYHDSLFPYSELYNNNLETEEIAAGNGISKVFIGAPSSALHYNIGEPVIIYRIHTGTGQKAYKSVATSYCTLTNITPIKANSVPMMKFEQFEKLAGNKTVYTKAELQGQYNYKKNLVLIEMIYNGFFGKGNNVTYMDLKQKGLFEEYPYSIRLTKDDFSKILEMGGKNVQSVIVNQS